MRQLLKLTILLIAISLPTFARTKMQGWCENGNQTVNVPAQPPSTTRVQRSYPSCTVTVYLPGTTNLATIYADNNGTSKANPFTSAVSGYWFYYVDDGTYDTQFSNAGISPPFSFGAMSTIDPYFDAPTSGVPRLISEKLVDILSVKDYGAECDGTTNDTTAFTNALAQNRTILVPNFCVVNSFTVPASSSLWFPQGGGLIINSGQTITFNGTIAAGSYEIFQGTGLVTINAGNEVQAIWWDAVDLFASVQEAIVALGVRCGRIEMPKGDFTVNTAIDAHDTRTCEIYGQGGPTGGAPSATRILFTGDVDRIVDARRTANFRMHDFMVLVTNPTFHGIGIDFGLYNGEVGNSAFGIIERTGWFCNPLNNTGAWFSIVFRLDSAQELVFRDNTLQEYDIGIQGYDASTGGTFSQVMTITNNHFSSSTGAATIAHISDPGGEWFIQGNAFEMGTGVGLAKAIACNDRRYTYNVHVVGNFIGDWGATGGELGTNLQICGSAWTIENNTIGCAPQADSAVEVFWFPSALIGASIRNNTIVCGGVGSVSDGILFHIDGEIFEVEFTANIMSYTQYFSADLPSQGMFQDQANGNKITIYGNGAGPTLTGRISMVNMQSCDFLSDTIGGGGGFLCGGYTSDSPPYTGKLYVGNGSGYRFGFIQRNGGVDTVLAYMNDDGDWVINGNITQNVGTNGGRFTTPGISVKDGSGGITVGGAGGTDHGGFTGTIKASSTCSIFVYFGIIYGTTPSTCP
jgi:hypothetical protein